MQILTFDNIHVPVWKSYNQIKPVLLKQDHYSHPRTCKCYFHLCLIQFWGVFNSLMALQFTNSPLDVSLSSAWGQRRLCCDWCISEPSVHDLSLWTRSSSIMSRGASPSKPKQENISLFLRFISPSPHSSHILYILSHRPLAFDKSITLLFTRAAWCC